MSSILLPDGINYITEGTIVVLDKYPGVKWVTHYGWYTYAGNQALGWYFSSIPAMTILPVDQGLLVGLKIVGKEDEVPTGPCPSDGITFTKFDLMNIRQAFISVENIADRDRLNTLGDIPDGKIVRVNDTEDHTIAYYEWDRASGKWKTAYLLDETALRAMIQEEIKKAAETKPEDPPTSEEPSNPSVGETPEDPKTEVKDPATDKTDLTEGV